jgi:hypothetical protein
MQPLGLLMLLHVLVIGGFVVARALHARLSPLPVPVVDLATGRSVGRSVVPSGLPTFPSGRQIEDYVESGVADLRIMLIQAARRRRG